MGMVSRVWWIKLMSIMWAMVRMVLSSVTVVAHCSSWVVHGVMVWVTVRLWVRMVHPAMVVDGSMRRVVVALSMVDWVIIRWSIMRVRLRHVLVRMMELC